LVELVVELEAVRRNTEAVVALLAPHGLELVAVTKACLGEPLVARAMLEGGAVALADTRDGNIVRLKRAFPGTEVHRIYLPPTTSPFEPGDLTYVSSPQGAAALAERAGDDRPLSAVVHLETGDGREGAPEEHLEELVGGIISNRRLLLAGISTNYACFAGCPGGLRESVTALAEAAGRLAERGMAPQRVSGGNSSLLALLREGERLPRAVTEIRCGEALLLGQDALEYRPLAGARSDGCRLRAEVLEGYTKAPPEEGGRRLVLGVGSQDLGAGELRFFESAFFEVGRSADYLVVGVREGGPAVSVGQVIEMIPTYYALSAAWTSPFVEVRFV
jgi:ornithine racemase